jgi:hypothetical protein
MLGGFPTHGGGDGPVPEAIEYKAAAYNNGGTLEGFQYTVINDRSADYMETSDY